MQRKLLTGLILAGLGTSLAWAAPPVFHTDACSVSVDNQRLDTVLTPAAADQRNTFAYEPLTHRWHFWGFLADDPNFPSAASSLRAVVHATSTDGIQFSSDSNLSYAFGSASYTNKYPPAKPEVLRLLAPQRGLFAIDQTQIQSHASDEKQTAGTVKLLGVTRPRQSRGFSFHK